MDHLRRTGLVVVGVLTLGLGACSGGDGGVASSPTRTSDGPASPSLSSRPSGSVSGSAAGRVPDVAAVDVLARDLEVPWGLAFLPDGSALAAQRDSGTIVRIAGGRRQEVARPEGVAHGGEGGLLGLAALTRGTSTLVVAYLTSTSGDNRILAMPWDGDSLGPARVILSGIPSGRTHNGGRMAFGPDGMLYVGTGDAGRREAAQDRGDLGGKILRITPGGGLPPDNPFPGSPVWSLGHRNVQGLAFDSAGRLWASEFGQNAYDELNLIERGANYGWPEVEGDDGDARFVRPQAVWRTTEASPSGVAIVDDVAYVASLRGRRVWQVPLGPDGAGEPRALLEGEFGRLRTAERAPDGSLWVTTSNRDGRGRPADDDDRLLRVRLR